MLLPMPGAILDFPSLSFQVPICGFAAKHATVAANDRAVTTAVIRVFICGGDSGRNAFGRQHQFQTIRRRQCPPFRFVSEILAEPYVGELLARALKPALIEAVTLCRRDRASSPTGYWRSAGRRVMQSDWSK